MASKSVPWGVAQPGVWVEDPQVQAALWSGEWRMSTVPRGHQEAV